MIWNIGSIWKIVCISFHYSIHKFGHIFGAAKIEYFSIMVYFCHISYQEAFFLKWFHVNRFNVFWFHIKMCAPRIIVHMESFNLGDLKHGNVFDKNWIRQSYSGCIAWENCSVFDLFVPLPLLDFHWGPAFTGYCLFPQSHWFLVARPIPVA